MKKAMTISYEIGDQLYLNLTNQCPCACTFCIRRNGDGAYGSDSLWLEHEPTLEEVLEDLKKRELSRYREVIFCGYGEPTARLALLTETARYCKEASSVPLRLNTNGLGDLIRGTEATHESAAAACQWMDTVSISLNGGDETVYNRVTNPSLAGAFDAMLAFADYCKTRTKTVFTVVDVISPEEIAAAQKTADAHGIPLRVRAYEG